MNPFYGMFNFTIGLIFILTTPFMLSVAKQNFREKLWTGFYSIIFAVILCFIIGFYYMINALSIYFNSLAYIDPSATLQFVEESFYKAGLFPYPMGSYVLFGALFTLVAIGIYSIYQKYLTQEGSDDLKTSSHALDLELARKIYHIGLIGMIVCYIIIGKLVMTGLFDYLAELYNNENFPGNFIPYYDLNSSNFIPYMGRITTLFPCIVIFYIFFFTDFTRLREPKYYMLKTMSNTWRPSEQTTFASQIYTMLGFTIPVLFLKAPIAAAALGITTMGDALATIIGVTKGTHKIREGPKTWEGSIAGFIGAFVSGFLCYVVIINLSHIYGPLYSGTIAGGLIISLVGALTFLLLDVWSPPICDNMLNPVFSGLTMFLVSLVII